MKFIGAIVLLFLGYTSFSQNCDCSYPVKQGCKEECGKLLLRIGTRDQLRKEWQLDDATIQKIMNVKDRSKKQSIQDFQDDLSYKCYVNLVEVINNWENDHTALDVTPLQKLPLKSAY